MSPDKGYYTYDKIDGVNASPDGKARIAAFDFDGTSIDGSSPTQLVFHLWKNDMLSKTDALCIGLWALRYKFRLPQDEASVHSRASRSKRSISFCTTSMTALSSLASALRPMLLWNATAWLVTSFSSSRRRSNPLPVARWSFIPSTVRSARA